MTDETLIKCLHKGGRSVHSFKDAQGHHGWDIPVNDTPGEWKGPVAGTLRPHHNGLHLAKKDYLIDWLTGYHYIAETSGQTVEGLDCVIARKARLIQHVPVNHAKLEEFCANELSTLPKILDGLAVYPKISKDAQACVDIIREQGLHTADKALNAKDHKQGDNAHYYFVRMNDKRLNKDALHSIEYNDCTRAAKLCLETIVVTHNLAQHDATIIDTAKMISNGVANAVTALHKNYLFMKSLCARGFDHKDEVAAMEVFLKNAGLTTEPVPDFFQQVRLRQNRDILPALGF